MSELHCLVIVLLSAMFSCFLLDSYELQEIISIVSQNMEPLSSLNISRRTYCSGCDEHACDTIIFFRWKLKNQYLKSIVITFCKKRLSCDRVVKQGLGNLSTLVSTWLSVIKSDKSVFVAQAKHILNFPYDFRKLYLIDTR